MLLWSESISAATSSAGLLSTGDCSSVGSTGRTVRGVVEASGASSG